MCLCVFSEGEEEEEEGSRDSVRQGLATRESRGHLQRIISIEEDHLPHLLQRDSQAQTPLRECSEAEEAEEVEEAEEAEDGEDNIELVMSDIYPQPESDGRARNAPTSLRGQPVGKETSISVRPVDTG